MTDVASGQLRVHVRLFAMQRELAGTRSVELTLPAGATIEDAWSELVGRFPVLAPGRPAVRFARNGSYAPAETALSNGDEVAMIPPVSGGSDDRRVRILELREAPFDAAILSELGATCPAPALYLIDRTYETDGVLQAYVDRWAPAVRALGRALA